MQSSNNQKQDYDNDNDDDDDLEHDADDDEGRLEFEEERDKILADLPDNIKSMFGQIGFTLGKPPNDDDDDDNDADNDEAEEIMIPVLIVSPYDVPPRPIRDVYWFDAYSKKKRTKQLKKLPYLIYHYGSKNVDDCYSFLEHNQFINYDAGAQHGYHLIPNAIKQQISSNQQLNSNEKSLIHALNEMNEDINKLPNERKRGNLQFCERHQEVKVSQLKPPPPSSSNKKAKTSSSSSNKKAPPPSATTR